MACSNCNTPNCGCSGTYVVSATCPPTCSEVFNAQCIVYTGADILCGTDTVIARNAYLDTALTNIVNYICTSAARRDDHAKKGVEKAPERAVAYYPTLPAAIPQLPRRLEQSGRCSATSQCRACRILRRG